MKLFKTPLGMASILIILLSCQTKADNKVSILDKTINKHFKAIENRNIDKKIEEFYHKIKSIKKYTSQI